MPILQTLSWGFFTITVGAIFFALRQVNTNFLDIPLHIILYAAFLFALRFKIALDDHFYFGVTKMRRWQSVFGLMIGLLSWTLIIFSAFSINNFADSLLLLIMAIGLSTLWILVIAIREGFFWEHNIWLATNAIYMVGAAFLLWDIQAQDHPHVAWIEYVVKQESTPIIVLVIMILTLLVDFWRSKSITHAQN